ncbi:MAG: glutamate mutase L [Anaerosomatales bacterium]|nr:glutamate mutase L [Anaerosomatales bacterium]
MSRRRVDALVAEIGSTTTVVSAFDGLAGRPATEPVVVGQGVAPTSVESGDVSVGLAQARAALEAQTGPLEPGVTLATSSAAGGLRMTVHGLTERMTARAAREAALGAGAVVKLATAGALSERDLERIEEARPSLVFLAGGDEGGDTETVLANARALRRLESRPAVIYGGNSAVADEARAVLEEAGFRVYVTPNVYPAVDELAVEPARRIIHDAFEEHITHAPGMERLADFVQGRILPTPGAVLLAAEALAEVVGDLVVVDVGGATTDVHSVTAGSPELAALATEPQPRAKRTVEGDLGTYVSAETTAALLPESERPHPLPPAIPRDEREVGAAALLARTAARAALERHAGWLAYLYTPRGRQTVVRGRDLTACRLVIGTGGGLVRLPGGKDALASGLARPNGDERLLPPADARVALDRDYVFACCGALLAAFDAEAVVALMLKSIGLGR